MVGMRYISKVYTLNWGSKLVVCHFCNALLGNKWIWQKSVYLCIPLGNCYERADNVGWDATSDETAHFWLFWERGGTYVDTFLIGSSRWSLSHKVVFFRF